MGNNQQIRTITTIELIAQHIAEQIKQQHPDIHTTINNNYNQDELRYVTVRATLKYPHEILIWVNSSLHIEVTTQSINGLSIKPPYTSHHLADPNSIPNTLTAVTYYLQQLKLKYQITPICP